MLDRTTLNTFCAGDLCKGKAVPLQGLKWSAGRLGSRKEADWVCMMDVTFSRRCGGLQRDHSLLLLASEPASDVRDDRVILQRLDAVLRLVPLNIVLLGIVCTNKWLLDWVVRAVGG